MSLVNPALKQKWVIAIALLIDRKPDCHTLKTYAYPVIQQGRKRVGIAYNLPPSLFFRSKKEAEHNTDSDTSTRMKLTSLLEHPDPRLRRSCRGSGCSVF
jgi:hypothetical protein